MPRRLARFSAAALLLGLLATAAARSQTTGSIEGMVRDSMGGVLAPADVLVSSPNLQGARTARTDRNGRFWLPALPPGNYAVTVALAGFRPDTKSVTISLGSTATLHFALDPSVQESIAVSGAPPLVDVTSTTGGTNYTSRVAGNLPVDRNYADVVRANPAVSTDQGATQGRSLALAFYGATSAENQWIIDGTNTTNVQTGIQGKAINNEFVQEVEVKTGAYSAEYGGALGGVVNVITKSGGNQFHGDAFLYYDSSDTSAGQVFTDRDSVNAEMRLADYQRLDYGADLGGYLLKDRIWFFGAYNRVNLDTHVSRVVSSPLVSVDDRFPLDGADNLYSGKITWNAASSTSLVATVFADPSTSTGATGSDPRQGRAANRLENPIIVNPDRSTWFSDRRVGGADYGLRATQLLGAWGLLTVQASHHQEQNSLTAPDGIRTLDFTCPGGIPEDPCSPPSEARLVTGGYGLIDGPLDHNISHRNQVLGDLTLSAGSHELKIGGGYDYGVGDATYSYSGGQEVIVLNELGRTYYQHYFAARNREDLTPVAGAELHARVKNYGLYLQDSWRLAAGLTVNLGLRWDNEHVIDYRGVTVLPLDNEWQPRVGVVWDPWKDGRTKLYAFAGRFYYTLPTFGTSFAFADITAVWTQNFDPVTLTQDSSLPGPLVWYGGGPFGDNVDRNIRGMYQDELAVGLERMIDPSLTIGLKATYRRLGNAIEDRCDFVEACAVINPGSGEMFARGDAPVCNGYYPGDPSDCSETGPATPPARRLYSGIEILARKSIGQAVWLQASYVYSSLRGNYDGAVNEGFQQTSAGLNLDFDWPPLWHNAYGRLYLDRPNRFRFDGYWVTPLRLAVGLQAFAASGPPLEKTGYYQDASLVYLVPRGSAGRLPTQWDANLTLSYPIAVGPATVTLQAYLFRIFNNQIATTRDNRWTTSPPNGYPATIYDPNQPSDNPEYGKFTSRQDPRVFRAAVRVSF